MDDVYRGYRIAVRLRDGQYEARITSVRGPALSNRPAVSEAEGEEACRQLARSAIDRYVAFLSEGER